ncbi:MJ0042-type zinc finger domain-containing protein [Piscinibacter sp.]|uniref:MJ0042-type zinc finger domain-containing protein n=1 Tax=Piscinibacter sp. TaxID=1903157 RepID=UPI002CFC31AA|nr:MJ0042-type zinc finger domain-containing protein [Albitalea sp.]HUG25012.1 MJ0042-type zinc finger domain-containing protein [Albitalea sp.]
MDVADGIRKRGFRKWYERELIQSHGHLVLTFLCAVGLFATFEVHSGSAPWSAQIADLGAVVLLSAVGVWSLRRYLYLLSHAEAIANQAVCPQCETYGRFGLVEDDPRRQQLKVRCRKCEHEWPIYD